jgi:hypothetical protein
LRVQSRGFKADSSDEGIEVVDNALIEAVELSSSLAFELCVCFDGAEKACGERRIHAFEELQKHEADRVSVAQKLIPARVGELGNEAFGTELGEVIAKRGQCVMVGVAAEGFDDGGMDFGSGEGIASRDVREADERMHEGELPRVIELEARNALSGSRDCRFCELS